MTSKYDMAARARKKKRKTSKLASLYGDKNKVTRGDIITAIKNKKKKK